MALPFATRLNPPSPSPSDSQNRKRGSSLSLDPLLKVTTAHRMDYSNPSTSHSNATSMLIQNTLDSESSHFVHHESEDDDAQLLHSSLCRPRPHRLDSENRALAIWLSLSLIQGKLVIDDPGITLDELYLTRSLTIKLQSSLHKLNPPTPAIFVAHLYLERVFPHKIEYCGNPDDECATALTRLFFLCLRLAVSWFEDYSEYYDHTGQHFRWHAQLGLEKAVFRLADIHVLHLLGHDLCVSNMAYARWLSHIVLTLPVFMENHLPEYRSIVALIHLIRPKLNPEFLHPNRLQCTGLPNIDDDWKPAYTDEEEFAERGRNLVDCVTFGLAIPLYTSRDHREFDSRLLFSEEQSSNSDGPSPEFSSSSGFGSGSPGSDMSVDSPPPSPLVLEEAFVSERPSSPASDSSSLAEFKRLYLMPKTPYPQRVHPLGMALHSVSEVLSAGLKKLFWGHSEVER